uniref:Epidermal anterior n=1 Tax=Hofstenia miamia TaxID=442651 RepID=A0A8K1Z269_HOFMI|nr:epidermal anterior [Hofstenia miamia]
MGDFIEHVKKVNWIDWKAWVCTCICPQYVYVRAAIKAMGEDAARFFMCFCPCTMAYHYMKTTDLPDSIINRILACFWTSCFTLCSLYVNAEKLGMDPVDEVKQFIDLTIKVVTINKE